MVSTEDWPYQALVRTWGHHCSHAVGEGARWCLRLGRWLGSLLLTEIDIFTWYRNAILRYLPQRNKHIWPQSPNSHQTTSVSTRKLMDKVWYTHTMEYYLAIKRKKNLRYMQQRASCLVKEARKITYHEIPVKTKLRPRQWGPQDRGDLGGGVDIFSTWEGGLHSSFHLSEIIGFYALNSCFYGLIARNLYVHKTE